MRPATFALATMLAVAPITGSAAAYVTVLGSSHATSCFQHARADRGSSQALDDCTSALEEENLNRRNRAGTYVNRGIVYMNRHAYDRALADFDNAIAIAPNLAEGYVNRGVVLLGRADYAGALAAVDRGLALDPVDPARAYYIRGIAHEELGRVREAYRDYRRAAELAPDWDMPRTELTRFRVG